MDYLKDKTRVLVTHKFECLKHVDYIFIFKGGKIVEKGTFKELENSPTFQEVENKYIPTEENSSANNVVEDIIEEEINLESSSERQEQIPLPVEDAKKDQEKQEKQETIEEDKALQEKLMLDEDREIGVVGWKVWKAYFNYYGGFFYFFLVFLGNIQSFRMFKDNSYVNMDLTASLFQLLALVLE